MRLDGWEGLAPWAVNFIANHPWVVYVAVALFFIFGLATCINYGIKTTWKRYETMPLQARFVLGFTMPLAFNFWYFGGKLGLQQPADELSPGTVRAAVARAEAAATKP